MKKWLALLGVPVVLGAGAVVILPSLVPAEKIKDEVVSHVKAATGRDLTIDGKVSVSVFPSLSVQVSNVALSSPVGFQSKDLLRLGAVDVRLKVLPILSGTVAVDSFILKDPIVTLEVARNGKANWQFEPPAAAKDKAADSSQTQSKGSASGGAASSGLSNISLGQVRLENGRLTYIDGVSGTREEVDGLNLSIDLKSLDDPLAVLGSAKWRAKALDVKIGLAKPRAMLDGSASPLDVAVKGEPLTMTFLGEAAANGTVKGTLDLSVPSVRGLMMWTSGKAVALAEPALGPLAIKGQVAAGAGKYALTQTDISLDAIKAKGDFTVDTNGPRPSVKGKLDVAALDVNPYLAGGDSAGKGAGAGGGTGGKSAPAASSGWSDDPIDASGLKAADVDFALSVGSMQVQKIKIGQSRLSVVVKNGHMVADLTELALYQGRASGRLSLDGTPPGIAVEANFSLKNLQAEPFLTDAADFSRLEGTGNGDLNVTGKGKSQRTLISSLSGKGAVTFTNGAIRGINLADMIRNVATAFNKDSGSSSAKTEFAELGGTYVINNGIVSNNDLSLKSPLLRVGGAGTVDLPQRSMKYRVEPKVVASLEGQGGKSDVAGIAVPVLIEGPWDTLSYRPDLEAMLKGQASKALGDALGGATGGASGGPTSLNPAKLFGR